MGRLLNLRDFKYKSSDEGLDPSLYFVDWAYDRPFGEIKNSFPHAVYAHRDHFSDRAYSDISPKLGKKGMVEIRRFVDRQCVGTVIRSYKEMDYEYCIKLEDQIRKSHDGYYRSKVEHGYYIFYCEEQTDAVMLTMKFSDMMVSEPSLYHPERDEDIADIEFAKDNYHKGRNW